MLKKSLGFVICLTIIMLLTVQGKKVFKEIYLTELAQIQSHTVFLTKFYFGVGESNITLQYKKLAKNPVFPVIFKVGLVTDERFQEFKAAKTCQQKQSIYKQTYKFSSSDSHYGTQFIKVDQKESEHMWFIYIYSCHQIELTQENKDMGLLFEVTLWNNGSHFGVDENILWPYAGLMVLWALLLFKILIPILKSLIGQQSPSYAESFLYSGYLLLILALFYRFIDLITKSYSGEDLVFFLYLYSFIKTSIEGVMVTVIVSIAWGWSLVYVEYKAKYILISIGVIICYIVSMIAWHSKDQLDDSYLMYEHSIGVGIFVLRILIFLVFIIGCTRVSTLSVGVRKHFISRYAKLGSIYLLAWPAAVVFCKIFLPKYMINQVVTILEEAVHLVMNAYICWLFAHPDSSYKKVSIKDEDKEMYHTTSLPDYVRRK